MNKPANVLTLSREHGAGGREVGQRIAERLGWEFLDREILHRAAALTEIPQADLERMDGHLAGGRSRRHPLQSRYAAALKRVVSEAAARGGLVVIGRGANFILRSAAAAFHLRLVAPLDARARRVADRERAGLAEAQRRCAEVDRQRGAFLQALFGRDGTVPSNYHLTVNTGRVPLADVVEIAVAAVRRDYPAAEGKPGGRRLLTLSRQLGAGERNFAEALGKRIGLPVVDRELIHREAALMGIPESSIPTFDESGPAILDRIDRGMDTTRYFAALSGIAKKHAEKGEVILVGRGGALFLKDHPDAFHVLLTADLSVRIRRVMAFRWINEGPAREVIAASDRARAAFYRTCFGVEWADPLHYDLVANTGRLGVSAVDLVAFGAERRWGR